MIIYNNGVFTLDTANTTYAFRCLPSGQLEQLHYGRKIHVDEAALKQKHSFPDGNTICYHPDFPQFSLENERLEYSSYGKGDIREPFIEIEKDDGSRTVDLVYDSHEIKKGRGTYETLPSSYGEIGEVEELIIYLKGLNNDVCLELHYYVYAACDIICRSAKLINTGSERIFLRRLMSMQLDLDDNDYVFTSFHGAWAREMNKCTQEIHGGRIVNSSIIGASSSRANPFVMLHRKNTTENTGECFGFNLIYSGNHYEAVEESAFGQVRFVNGINPSGFCFKLEEGESFEAPEAVMTYSYEGFNRMSRNMHSFIRNHIVRGEWKNKVRPILLNSWEAAYFKINEKVILNLAKEAADCGIELFVMDDGWFGERNDDKSSLGDWEVNKKKLPGGLGGIAKKINDMGMKFGIWVEPEMVNVNSNLYKNHPDWAIKIPDKNHSEGRNQRILDLNNEDVREYIIEAMSKIFETEGISYVKWDMNRFFTDVYSPTLEPMRQGELFHRYMIGLYQIMDVLTKRFPHILFEGCAAGGNRFDLGILCYFPQIWASDNTDALCRVNMMENYSYGYPMSVVSAHVSAAVNHQTLRKSPLNTRYNVASFGVMGYEINLCDISKEEKDAVKKQTSQYKKWRDVFFAGDFYRGRSGNIHEWTVVSKDKKRAAGLLFQERAIPNMASEKFIATGLAEDKKYHIYNDEIKVNIRRFGDLINTASPIHIKDDSFAQKLISKKIFMDGEVEDYVIYGDLLTRSGLRLRPGYAATGYDGTVRFTGDLFSRMYLMEEDES
ncbi:MAG: alpha-galactosidase [Eubacterium sp.]|nr:alpha-galactosidase [Eubacterium sp.]